MKQLKSSLGDLRRLVVRNLTLRDIAEPLASFDAGQAAPEVHACLEERGFDVAGVRGRGVVTGFALRTELGPGRLGDHRHPFGDADVRPDTEPLLTALDLLRQRRHVFITVLGQVGGIVTRGDLQKAPVRLWLFGLVSLLEMQLLRIIRLRYPAEAWQHLLSAERLEGARRVFEERRRRHEETDLPECLQLGDKATILRKDPSLPALTGFTSRRALSQFFEEIESLRNALAHANDIVGGRWRSLAELVARLEELLEQLETANPGPAEAAPSGDPAVQD